MTSLQKFLVWILPRRWAASLEAESRRWKIRCPCGFERSFWELGGGRWKAAATELKDEDGKLKMEKCVNRLPILFLSVFIHVHPWLK